jgi:hypothetical protein
MIPLLENTLVLSYKVKHSLLCDIAIPLLGIDTKKLKQMSKDLRMDVQDIFIHNSQKLKT